jgi:DNA polymerase family B
MAEVNPDGLIKQIRQRRDFLEPLTSEIKKKPFVVFDIESKRNDTQEPGFTRPFMVGFYDGKKFTSFYNDDNVQSLPWYERAYARGGCIDKLMRHLLGQQEDNRYNFQYRDNDVYAHNLGAFDGLFLPAWLEKNNKWTSYKVMPVQSRIQTIETWRYTPSRPRRNKEERKKADQRDRKMGVLRFLDSFRVMPISLDKVIKMFKLREGGQGKLEIDMNIPEWDREKWDEYNRVDTVELWRAMQKYQELIISMGGEVGITAPSTAVKLLRRKYLKPEEKIYRNIHFSECNDEACEGCAHQFIRTAYFGGRTEVYQFRGEGWYYDVNSSYPFSMKKPMPVGEMEVTGENEDFTRYLNPNHWVGFVRCTVEIPRDCYLPPLPIPLDGKLKFPAGRFSGTWDWCELAALQRIGGTIIHVEKAVWIKARKFLGQFVDSLYSMRDKKSPDFDLGRSETAKIMMNSTFGKFGMEQDRLEMIILKKGEEEPYGSRFPGESIKSWERRMEKEKAIKGPKLIHGGNLKSRGGDDVTRLMELKMPSGAYEHDSLIRIRDIKIDAAYIIPQIASHITALSRHLLWCYSMDILDRGKQIFYSDTDSVLTDCNDIPESSELGRVKKEFNGEKIRLTCYGPKTYILEKDTPFEGEHVKGESTEGKAGPKKCVETCPGCMEKEKGKKILGEHEIDEQGQRMCVKKCPGCSLVKVMMKGVPKELRTRQTLISMADDKEEVSFQLHEKLGALAKSGFRRTPLMVDIKKSMKSEYDKRAKAADGNDTLPLFLDAPMYLSQRFIDVASEPNYAIPGWMKALTVKGNYQEST